MCGKTHLGFRTLRCELSAGVFNWTLKCELDLKRRLYGAACIYFSGARKGEMGNRYLNYQMRHSLLDSSLATIYFSHFLRAGDIQVAEIWSFSGHATDTCAIHANSAFQFVSHGGCRAVDRTHILTMRLQPGLPIRCSGQPTQLGLSRFSLKFQHIVSVARQMRKLRLRQAKQQPEDIRMPRNRGLQLLLASVSSWKWQAWKRWCWKTLPASVSRIYNIAFLRPRECVLCDTTLFLWLNNSDLIPQINKQIRETVERPWEPGITDERRRPGREKGRWGRGSKGASHKSQCKAGGQGDSSFHEPFSFCAAVICLGIYSWVGGGLGRPLRGERRGGAV